MTVPFDELQQNAATTLIKLALEEDLQQTGDLTCQALIDPSDQAEIQIVARQQGILAGSPITSLIFSELDPAVACTHHLSDGDTLEPGSIVTTCAGPLASILIGERTVLNFLTHLCGVSHPGHTQNAPRVACAGKICCRSRRRYKSSNGSV